MVFLNTCYFVFAWLFLYVYVLGDALNFVIVLFSEWCFQIPTSLRWLGEVACCAYLQNVLMYDEKTALGSQNQGCEGRLGILTFPLAAFVKYA